MVELKSRNTQSEYGGTERYLRNPLPPPSDESIVGNVDAVEYKPV